MSTLYEHKGQWLTLEQFRKVREIDKKEKEVIEIKDEKIEIIEPEIKPEVKSKKKK